MTLVEYLQTHNMKQIELSALSGVPVSCINRHIHKGTGFSAEYMSKLEKLGIEFADKTEDPKGEKLLSGFDYFKNGIRYMMNTGKKADSIHCWTEEQVDYVTNYLNHRKIAYYCYYKDCYWVINYDKTVKEEDVCQEIR